MTKVGAFEVLGELSKQNNKKLIGFGADNIAGINVKGNNGQVTILVDPNTAFTLIREPKKLRLMLIVVDSDEYEKAEKTLAATQDESA